MGMLERPHKTIQQNKSESNRRQILTHAYVREGNGRECRSIEVGSGTFRESECEGLKWR